MVSLTILFSSKRADETNKCIFDLNLIIIFSFSSFQLLDYLASETTGYCGADMKALTTEACLCCLRRQYPQIYESKVKLDINLKYLVVKL